MAVETTPEFRGISPRKRDCYFSDEAKLEWHDKYSEPNCVTECVWKFARDACNCVPWFLREHFPSSPICEFYGNKCYKNLVDNRYEMMSKNGCGKACLVDCELYQIKIDTKDSGTKQHCEEHLEDPRYLATCFYVEAKKDGMSEEVAKMFANG